MRIEINKYYITKKHWTVTEEMSCKAAETEVEMFGSVARRVEDEHNEEKYASLVDNPVGVDTVSLIDDSMATEISEDADPTGHA